MPPNTRGLAKFLKLGDGFLILSLCLMKERHRARVSRLRLLDGLFIVVRHPVDAGDVVERVRRKRIDFEGPPGFRASLLRAANQCKKRAVVYVGRAGVELDAALKLPVGSGPVPVPPPE